MKRIVILQPGYLPWLGFFDQLVRATEFIIYDDVQYDRRGWRNRNRIKGPEGPVWLTVPVVQKGLFHQRVNETRIDNSSDWAARQVRTLSRNYAKAPYFDDLFPALSAILTQTWDLLIDLDMALIHLIAQQIGINTPLRYSSELPQEGGKTGRLIEICLATGADTYLTGNAAKGYIDEDAFRSAGITLEYQNYQHPTYRQRFGDFIPYLSAVDLVFNEGPASLIILSNTAGGTRSEIEEKGSDNHAGD